MKKYCSSCGTQLELSKRYCVECGDVNPYFVPAFLLLSDQSDALEKLRLEKEKIERELLEKQEKQAEFIRQELLRKELEEDEWRTKEALAKEVSLQEAAEREKTENELKKEILQLKEEAELNKKETIGMLRVVRYELQQKIDNNNKQLKEEFEMANRQNLQATVPPVVPEVKVAAVAAASSKATKRSTPVVAMILFALFLLAGVAYFYFNSSLSNKPNPETAFISVETPSLSAPVAADTLKTETANSSLVDTTAAATKPLAEVEASTQKTEPAIEPATKSKTVSAANAVFREPAPASAETTVRVTESKIRADIVGKKLSGCGITVNKRDEIEELGSLVLIETLPSGSLKYKFTAKIVQGEDTYNATPYIYYSSKGGFIKIDGTNCE